MKNLRFLFLVFLLLPVFIIAQETELNKFLKSIPGAEIIKRDTSSYDEFYILMLPQLVDHNKSNGPTFRQRIFIGHMGFDRPMVMVTEGYGADNVGPKTKDEPTKILKANQLYVEHRYFGPSTPNPVDWQYLTAEQDAGDYHYIRELFGKVYKGKWIATGVSKGGQTATEYKVFYPDDVDVTIPYVAPLNYERLDPRIDAHFNLVGTAKDRKHIKDIQVYLFKHKKPILAEWEKIAKQVGLKFTFIDAETAYGYSVLEFPFSFWQYSADVSRLPDLKKTDFKGLAMYLFGTVTPFWYTEMAKPYEAAGYQFYTQLGYYEYDEKPFKKWLKNIDYPNSVFVPKDAKVEWDPSYIEKLRKFIESNPQHMIFIYGESDPWGATAAEIKPGSGNLKIVKKGGTHGTQIASLNSEQRKLVINKLEEWLGMEIE